MCMRTRHCRCLRVGRCTTLAMRGRMCVDCERERRERGMDGGQLPHQGASNRYATTRAADSRQTLVRRICWSLHTNPRDQRPQSSRWAREVRRLVELSMAATVCLISLGLCTPLSGVRSVSFLVLSFFFSSNILIAIMTLFFGLGYIFPFIYCIFSFLGVRSGRCRGRGVDVAERD